jgi:hypothetical protein
VITGFNTDIERDGVVYHVQTEDKGLESPLILSLVYSGGEILAAKRTPYQDLIAEGFTDEALAERLKRQHRLICAAINAGRIEELKQMSGRREGARTSKPDAKVPTSQEPAATQTPPPAEASEEFVIERASDLHSEAALTPDAPAVKVEKKPRAPRVSVAPPPAAIHEEFEIETSSARPAMTEWKPEIEEPAKAAQPIPPTSSKPGEPPVSSPKVSVTSDSAYTVYDSRRPSRPKKTKKRDEQLTLTILDDEELRAGQSVTIRLLLQRIVSDEERPLGGVQLSIKVLGATFRPQLYTVKTQRDGVAVMSIDIPRFSSGRAAIVIHAEAQGESVELRRVIHPVG